MLIIIQVGFAWAQNPHGDDFRIDCAQCHTSDSWSVDYRNIAFDHSTTDFVLEGRHTETDCIVCHQSLVLSKVEDDCAGCHTDVHQNTLTPDCGRCHNAEDWLIPDITDIHEEAGFILTGAHIFLDCQECHVNSVELVFEGIGTDCIACHEKNYNEVKNPDHVKEGFSTDCSICHDLEAMNWVISHDFFPLEKGHGSVECSACHLSSDYTVVSSECISCHNQDYENATNPDHTTNSFPQNCTDCHTLDPGWAPAKYTIHDENDFPIYSGKHEGEWSSCTDCHLDPGDYSVFSCLNCHEHEKSKMDDKHDDESGYVYDSNACYKCHPDGSE